MVTGYVLTSAAPGRRVDTQSPSLLNSAVVASGLSAPTEMTGSASGRVV